MKTYHSMTSRLNKNTRLPIAMMVSLSLGLGACQSYKELPAPPQIETENLLRANDSQKQDSTTIADIMWKEYFTDPHLQTLISEGLEKNIDLKIALARIKQSKAGLSIAAGADDPSLAFGAEIQHTRTSSGDDGKKVLGYTTNQNMLGFFASWEIDLWGKLNNESRAQYANYLSSQAYKNLVQTQLVASIANAYYNLLSLDKKLQVTEQTAVLLEKSVETMDALKQAGQLNAASVEQSKALLYRTRLSLPTIKSQIRTQENALCILLDRNLGAIERSSIDTQTITEKLAYGVPAQLLSKRPDVKQAELSVLAAYATTNAAEASFYPSLNISSASFGLASGEFSNFFRVENLAANIVSSLTMPLFNKNQLTGQLNIAEAQQEEALLNFRHTVINAGREVSDILFNYESALSKNAFRDQQIASLSKAVDYTQQLLVAGEANYNDVLLAQQDLLSAQLSRVEDKLEQLTYGVNLYKALGGGQK